MIEIYFYFRAINSRIVDSYQLKSLDGIVGKITNTLVTIIIYNQSN